MLDVVVPNGAGPGSMFMVADPNTGQQFQVSVPEGATPGATFKVAVPKPVATTVIQQVVQPVIQQVALPNSAIPGYRTTKQDGHTALKQPNAIYLTSWELAQPTNCEAFCAFLRCSYYDTKRAYIYSRDNMSLEVNDTNSLRSGAVCTLCCEVQDNVKVYYYDRSPLSKECNCAPISAWPFCIFFYCSAPKLEPLDEGCLICFNRVGCENLGCGGKQVVIMPFE